MLKVVAVARCRGGGRLGYHRAPALLWCAVTASSRHRLFSTSRSRRNPDASLADIRNIGIIAHVDAGKTTTTERMLYYSGLTRHLGNVDHGDTVTDFLPLERERGITIQSAAITFNWPLAEDCPEGTHPKTINLIDTPGHQDFRFEVDRCLPVLDGAVCIIDSVKGVEAHTERVWSSAQQFKIPRIVYVNKLDRDGASFKRSVLDIASKLNCFPLVCQLPWWDNDSLIGVIDVIEKKAIRYNSADNYQVYQGETLSSVLQSNAALLQEISIARDRLIERLCEYDDELVEEFADKGNDLPAESIKKSIRRLILTGEGEVAPVFAGSSLRNMGVQPLLDAVVDYLPSPQDTADVEVLLSGEKHQLQDVLQRKIPGLKPKPSTAHKPPIEAVASVFKVVNDPSLRDATRGMMSFVRVYHGTLNRNSQVWNANLGCFEKSLRMVQISASKTADVPHLSRGQIGALIGLKDARTGDTLQILPSHSHRSPDQALRSMQIRPPDIPAAVAFLAIHPFSDTGRDHLQQCLEKASREDPSLRWNRDEKHDRFVLSGMGKLHLEIAIHRLKTQYKVDAAFGDIEVDYKECLTAPTGEHRYEYDRVVASKAGKAACVASLEPRDQHDEASILESSTERDGNLFHIKIILPDDGELPFDPELVRKQLFNGAYAAMARGPRRGSPMHSCCVSITFDPETDFFGPGTDGHIVNAAYNAVRTALSSAHSQSAVGVLEPVMKANISCPEEAAGTIQHDIASARGGQVLEVNDANVASADSIIDLNEVYAPPDPYESLQSLRDAKKGVTRMLDIVAKVPLKEMLDYDGLLRSKTGGRHSLTMSLDTFDRVTGPREKGL